MPWIVLDRQLTTIQHEDAGYVPIPMALGIFVEGREHDGEDGLNVVTDKVAKVLVVPEVESALSNLTY